MELRRLAKFSRQVRPKRAEDRSPRRGSAACGMVVVAQVWKPSKVHLGEGGGNNLDGTEVGTNRRHCPHGKRLSAACFEDGAVDAGAGDLGASDPEVAFPYRPHLQVEEGEAVAPFGC